MDSYILLSLVDYIQLLHKGRLDKSLYSSFENELRTSTPFEVNMAIENLIIRYKDVAALEKTVARFIRAASVGLDLHPVPAYGEGTFLSILSRENRVIQSLLTDMKEGFLQTLPRLKQNSLSGKAKFLEEIGKVESLRSHYLKLQYGLFSALESAGAPAQCIKLMWHLEDSIWPSLKDCRALLTMKEWDFKSFNRIYGQMYYLLGTLLYREEKILYPVAAASLPEALQRTLVKETESYGILS